MKPSIFSAAADEQRGVWSTVALAGGTVAALAGSLWLYRRMNTEQKTNSTGLAAQGMETIDVGAYLQDPDSEASIAACRQLCACLERCGALIVRDPRVKEQDNQQFMDMMERYYAQPASKTDKDVRPDLHYQVGVTPAFVEQPRCASDPSCIAKIDDMPEEIRAHKPSGKDPKWRYFWAIGDRPAAEETKFPALNAAPVIPQDFPEWQTTMDSWGTLMLQSSKTVAEMAAKGWGMPFDTFTKMMEKAPHILGPTGSDLAKYNKEHQVLAGFHNDLNFLTIHGKSRYPGLYIWLKDGSRMTVKVPGGCLLMQAGQQLEYLTGGEVIAGFHEVVVTDSTVTAIEKARAEGRSLWRVSSTLFSQIASDEMLRPKGHFANAPRAAEFPPMLCGDQVARELAAIALRRK